MCHRKLPTSDKQTFLPANFADLYIVRSARLKSLTILELLSIYQLNIEGKITLEASPLSRSNFRIAD